MKTLNERLVDAMKAKDGLLEMEAQVRAEMSQFAMRLAVLIDGLNNIDERIAALTRELSADR